MKRSMREWPLKKVRCERPTCWGWWMGPGEHAHSVAVDGAQQDRVLMWAQAALVPAVACASATYSSTGTSSAARRCTSKRPPKPRASSQAPSVWRTLQRWPGKRPTQGFQVARSTAGLGARGTMRTTAESTWGARSALGRHEEDVVHGVAPLQHNRQAPTAGRWCWAWPPCGRSPLFATPVADPATVHELDQR